MRNVNKFTNRTIYQIIVISICVCMLVTSVAINTINTTTERNDSSQTAQIPGIIGVIFPNHQNPVVLGNVSPNALCDSPCDGPW